MACSPLSPSLPEGPRPQPSRAWEPALSQLHSLPRAALDRLVLAWLLHLGLHAAVALNRRGSVAVYQATLGEYPVRTPVRVRLYQRKNRLQRHHVEAFAGYLDRFAIPAGILVTTGGVAPEAALLAATSERPRLALYSGEEWAADLADRGVGLRRRSLRQWIVDLQRALPPRLQRVSRRDHDA